MLNHVGKSLLKKVLVNIRTIFKC